VNEIDLNRRWVEQWALAGPLLAQMERQELRSFDFAKNWQMVDGLLQLGFDVPNCKCPDSSGLVEQQRLFSIARR
jgi:hypothetical protein